MKLELKQIILSIMLNNIIKNMLQLYYLLLLSMSFKPFINNSYSFYTIMSPIFTIEFESHFYFKIIFFFFKQTSKEYLNFYYNFIELNFHFQVLRFRSVLLVCGDGVVLSKLWNPHIKCFNFF